MFPEDRVLVGVINRKRDLKFAEQEHWYRIPQKRFSDGIHAEYLAFFLSKAFGEKNGAVHYFAKNQGVELVYRKDLMPKEVNHKRANEVYYKIQLGNLREKIPPITNPTRRSISFIYTTWDRFVNATQIRDLYSDADYFVDRIYHALRNKGIRASRLWEAERQSTGHAAQLRILCEKGTVIASTEPDDSGNIFLRDDMPDDALLAKIMEHIAKQGGPVMINIPLEDH
ncbi:MAG: hypothetical protein D6737_11330 [Chloroflexi bacterium]|nr:MAG: hypothetical protein D6737_11330 [Chloroflexota bacterium]